MHRVSRLNRLSVAQQKEMQTLKVVTNTYAQKKEKAQFLSQLHTVKHLSTGGARCLQNLKSCPFDAELHITKHIDKPLVLQPFK